MKFAPFFYLCLALGVVLIIGCRQENKSPSSPQEDQQLERPDVKLPDSSLHQSPSSPSIPESESPIKAKKKSGSELDTLRPIKA